MKRYAAICLFLLMALLAACTVPSDSGTAAIAPTQGVETTTPTPSPSPSVSPSPSPSPSEVVEDPGPVDPLTGLPMDEEQLGRRPVAVMLNNLREALPQQGNGQADIIYEVVTEGGITRMLGVYQSLEEVGTLASVRSARTAFLEIALGHDAVYIHAGGSEEAYAKLDEWDMDHMDGVRGFYSYADTGLFWRERDRVAGMWFDSEHSLVTSGETVLKLLAESGFRLEHGEGYTYEMAFADDGTPADGERAETVTVPHSAYKTGVFRYDAENGLYLAEQYGGAYIDGNTGEQIAVTNVLILRATVTQTGDSYGHTDVDLSGGDGWFACGGRIVPITWEKGGRDGQFRYYTADGEPLTLGRGKSYVSIISDRNEISYE